MTKKAGRDVRAANADEIVSTHRSRDAINRARQILRDAVPAAHESVKWNAPSFATADHFATFFLGGKRPTEGFQVILHLGTRSRPDSVIRSQITDPAGLLEWRSPDRAVIAFRDEPDVVAKAAAFREIVREWASFIEALYATEPTPR